MTSSFSLSRTRLGAPRAVIARGQAVVAAAGYCFYGYWFSQRRA